VFAVVVHDHDVGMAKPSQRACFACESLAELPVFEIILLEQLDGDEAI
jgi:hypothetical protein